jgi:hypothetical protein
MDAPKISNHQVLWSGKFLDGILTFALPTEKLETTRSHRVGLVWTIHTGDILQLYGTCEVASPASKGLSIRLDEIIENLKAQYAEMVIFPYKESYLAAGGYLQ